MTGRAWLKCTGPQRMLDYLRGKASPRKLRLFAYYCCAEWANLGTDDELEEEYPPEARSVGLAYQALRQALAGTLEETVGELIDCLSDSVWSEYDDAFGRKWDRQRKSSLRKQAVAMCALIRELFGNPFRPVAKSADWLTPVAVALARAAYKGTASKKRRRPVGTLEPDRLAVLADALEEAGCADADILGHLRGPGPHVRGCFVIDTLLDKK
jgi:hypothetical protein